MQLPLRYRFLQFLIGIKDWFVAMIISLSIWLIRLIPRQTATRMFEGFARWLGPKIWRHKVVVDNLAIAFPEKTDEERKQLASDSWAQMARSLVEYVHLDDIFDMDENSAESDNIEVKNAEQFLKLRDDGLPAILFTGHIANFELLPMVASRFGLEIYSLFRQPNNKHAASHVAKARKEVSKNLISSGSGAAFKLVAALEKGDHVGLLVDQKFRKGIKVPFFGKDAPTNTLLAKLARRYNCPVHGARCIRLPDGRFRLEITDELELPRDKDGDVDLRGTTELVTSIVEGWVREHPEQWLWMHRRWG
jgi:KDO2-lipid IV(A) lauroyltransferase